MSFVERLAQAQKQTGTCLCLGLDPDFNLVGDIRGARSFVSATLEAAIDHVSAVKANAAFYLQFGHLGWQLLEDVRQQIPHDRIFIVDAKMGDIGNTASAYARAIFGVIDADAVTLNPLMGSDAIDPFAAHEGKGSFLVARSSNPSALDLLDIPDDDEPLYERIVGLAGRYPTDNIGLVVGATDPNSLARVDQLARERFLLIPGLGAQGGEVHAVQKLIGEHGAPTVVSIGRGISEDPDGVATACKRWAELLAINVGSAAS